ncbi:cysteine desulfurase family protein [Lentibacillus saliphilus]|uniref:cysteine desulfurase family protein n=1 Tax=Lentibacillus saliphilus TaxID=2737028 RepID=UPI001C309A25|nr:cysteine desulfurase family protein [Lentibacillus saliphilus]
MQPIYMDHAATTPIDLRVIEAMNTVYTDVFGNPSSIHSYGRKARQQLDAARRTMASSIAAHEKDIIFTSGGTEADNLALIGTAFANVSKGRHIITTVQEHHATLHTAEYLEEHGFDVTYLPVDEHGLIRLEDFDHALRADTILVSVMYVNNETGVIQPIKEIGDRLKNHQAYFHTDAVQAFGLIDINVKELGVDLLSVSAHKINGPKGIGFLYAGAHVHMQPLQIGGQQERKRRAGTENVAGAVGFQKAVELAQALKVERVNTYQIYKNMFIDILKQEDIHFTLNGQMADTVPTIMNVSFPGTQVEALLINLDLEGVAVSSGSACTAGSVDPSHVLCSMYSNEDPRTTNSIRFSFGIGNTRENVEDGAKRTARVIKRLTKN